MNVVITAGKSSARSLRLRVEFNDPGKRPVPTHSMNKIELVRAVQKQLGSDTSRAAAERAVAAVMQAIKTGVKKDKLVQLVGFGTFRIVERKARKGVHPKTLQPMKIPKSKAVKFVPAKDFRTRV